MAWLGSRRAGWWRIGAFALIALLAAPCIARAQEDTPDQQATLTAMFPIETISALMAPEPLATTANFEPSGGATVVPGLDDRGRALDCMSVAIAYEAAGQPVEGQQAVGQVILNRMRDARFPKSVCGVVFQGSERLTGCQFTFTCDGSFRRQLGDNTLMTARSIAESVMNGAVPDRVAGATHYHADYVLPYWAASGQRVARIGAHIFYRMPGDLRRVGELSALTLAEPDVPALRRFSGGRHGSRPGIALVQAAPTHAVFAPWGLPVGGASQR